MFFFYYDMTNNLHLFYIDSAESKNCAFDIRTENGVLPEKRFVGLHTLMCHAEREKTLSRASVMPCGCGTCSATLEISNFLACVSVFFYIYWPKICIVQYFLMLNIVLYPFAYFEAGLVINCFICAYTFCCQSSKIIQNSSS